MSASKVPSPPYKVWTVLYALPGEDNKGKLCHTGCTTSERIFKECQLIKGWDTQSEKPKTYGDLDALRERRELGCRPARRQNYSLHEWCSWWINDQTCELDKKGQSPKSNVQVGLYCALLYHRKKITLMALNRGIDISKKGASFSKWHERYLNEALDRFEVVQDAGLDAVRAQHIHDFGREELSMENMPTDKEVKEHLEELLKVYDTKYDDDEDSNYPFG